MTSPGRKGHSETKDQPCKYRSLQEPGMFEEQLACWQCRGEQPEVRVKQ